MNTKVSKVEFLKYCTAKKRAIVEGVNMVSKHTKPNAKSPQGGIIKKEAPIHISNLECWLILQLEKQPELEENLMRKIN